MLVLNAEVLEGGEGLIASIDIQFSLSHHLNQIHT